MQVYNIFLYVFNILMQNFRNKVEVKLLSKFEAGKKKSVENTGLATYRKLYLYPKRRSFSKPRKRSEYDGTFHVRDGTNFLRFHVFCLHTLPEMYKEQGVLKKCYACLLLRGGGKRFSDVCVLDTFFHLDFTFLTRFGQTRYQ